MDTSGGWVLHRWGNPYHVKHLRPQDHHQPAPHLEDVQVVLLAVEWKANGVTLSQTRELAQGGLQARGGNDEGVRWSGV